MSDEREARTIYEAVVDDEQRYPVWPAGRENALGRRDAGKSGLKAEAASVLDRAAAGTGPRRRQASRSASSRWSSTKAVPGLARRWSGWSSSPSQIRIALRLSPSWIANLRTSRHE